MAPADVQLVPSGANMCTVPSLQQLEKLEARALAASRAAAAATAKTKQVGDQIRQVLHRDSSSLLALTHALLPPLQLTAAVAAEKSKTPELERLYLVKKKTLEMLPNAAKHIADLQKICAASAAKLVKLAAEWEVHRRPRIEAIRQHKQSKSLRKVRSSPACVWPLAEG